MKKKRRERWRREVTVFHERWRKLRKAEAWSPPEAKVKLAGEICLNCLTILYLSTHCPTLLLRIYCSTEMISDSWEREREFDTACVSSILYSPQTKWVMIPGIITSAPLAFFRAERSELAGRAQINTLVLSGSTPQSSHNIEPPPPPRNTHTLHTHQPDPWHSSAVLSKHDCRQCPEVSSVVLLLYGLTKLKWHQF